MNNLVALGILSCLTYTVSFAQPEVSGSFHNLSKPQGGPVSTGDIIEIRAVISVPQNTDITRLRFTDVVPAGTVYVLNSMKAMTNEGVYGGAITNTGVYTDLPGDDAGTLILGNAIHINLGDLAGTGATANDGGNVNGGYTIPRFQDRATIVQAAYRVQVTATANQSILLAGTFDYRDDGSADQTRNVQGRTITILPELNCSGLAFTNLILAENGGTFSSGTNHDRGASANTFDFNYTPVTIATPNDGDYAITKNSSPTEFTANNPDVSDKVFGIWDIAGDHTGSLDGVGNPPVGAGDAGGYMLLVNASYAPNAIFTTTINNLLPGTIYTLSFWVRNICSMCGYDPVTGDAVFAPGVKPNLAFAVNGEDLYTTGDLTYTGEWILKSFTFSSGALTTANITIKNNAPGGGGNDWALDDISITSCLTLLPVDFEKFEAKAESGSVSVFWSTGNEQMTAAFDVEYSDDGRVFQKAGTVPSNGGNSEYSFTHQRELSGKRFYRLKYLEPGGKTAYSRIITANRSGAEVQEFRMIQGLNSRMPEFKISSPQPDQLELRIVDATGKLYFSTRKGISAGNSVLQIPAIGNPARGIYFAHFKTSRKTTVIRFMVQ